MLRNIVIQGESIFQKHFTIKRKKVLDQDCDPSDGVVSPDEGFVVPGADGDEL